MGYFHRSSPALVAKAWPVVPGQSRPLLSYCDDARRCASSGSWRELERPFRYPFYAPRASSIQDPYCFVSVTHT